MPAVQAVTWDLVGTLVVPHPSVGAIYAEVAAAHGIDRDAGDLEHAFPAAFATVRARWGTPYGRDEDDALHFWGTVIQETFGEGLPGELIYDLFDTFAHGARWRVLPGVREGLALVAQAGVPQAVVSNFDARMRTVIEELALGPFATLVASASVGVAKPDPAVLQEACRRLGVPPTAVVHVGDSEREDGAMCAALQTHFLRIDGAVPVATLAGLVAR